MLIINSDKVINRKKKNTARTGYKNMDMLDRTYKKKRICVDREYELNLKLAIYDAEEIDNPADYPDLSTSARCYRVFYWVHPEEEHYTGIAYGLPNPIWRVEDEIELNKNKDCRYLSLEIVRCSEAGRSPDPGTSTGECLVGRTRIQLPTLGKRSGRFGLVRFDGAAQKPEGHISLTLETRKRYVID